MNEEKINQILKNQITIMSSVEVQSGISRIALMDRIKQTIKLLVPTLNNKSAVEEQQERTEEFFKEDLE